MEWRIAGVIWAMALSLCVVHSSVAQETTKRPASVTGVNLPLAEKLVKNTIIAIDQGNATGNYSVLRELGTSNFQRTTSTAKLSDAFAQLRRMKLDLSALVMLKPVFSKAPISEKGQVRIVGYFPTKPIRINFSMTYAQQNGKPKLAGVRIVPVKATASAEGGASQTTGKSDQQ